MTAFAIPAFGPPLPPDVPGLFVALVLGVLHVLGAVL
jgi:hypothetical protein